MKILPLTPRISTSTRQMLKEHVKNFDKLITKDNAAKMTKLRNKWGLPLHVSATIKFLYDIIEGCEPVGALFCAKINYDFVQFIRNINKHKAALLSGYLKSKGIEKPEEIKYAVKKYFTKLGMPLYPLTHPKGMRKIVEESTYPRSFETGIFVARTDKNSILYRYLKRLRKAGN